MKQKLLPTYQSLTHPLPLCHPKAIYYKSFRLLLQTIGRLSQGIRIGLNYGFDSGLMLEYVYRNRPSGITYLGKVIDRIYLNSQGWQGIRQRGGILKQILHQTIQANCDRNITTKLLDVACGSGRYDLEVLLDFPSETVSANLRDYQVENVAKARELAAHLGVTANIEPADAFSDADLKQINPAPNLIVVSGLHEILPDNQLISAHFHQLYRILEPGGTLIYTIQPYHPQLELIARTLNSHNGKLWVMRLRSFELTKQWATQAGFSNFTVQMEPSGIFGVVTAQKKP